MIQSHLSSSFFKELQKKILNDWGQSPNTWAVKRTFFWKSNAANRFSHCITPTNDIEQFSQKNFDD